MRHKVARQRLAAQALFLAPQEMISVPGLVSAPTDLGKVLAALRALQHLYQTFHWAARGANSYSDHKLFGRLYSTVEDEIDKVGEREVGTYGWQVTEPRSSARLFLEFLDRMDTLTHYDSKKFAECAYMAEMCFQAILKVAREGATNGTVNMLDDMADTHESNLYLLRQNLDVDTLGTDMQGHGMGMTHLHMLPENMYSDTGSGLSVQAAGTVNDMMRDRMIAGKALVDEIMAISGLPEPTATKIFNLFQKKKLIKFESNRYTVRSGNMLEKEFLLGVAAAL